MGDEAHRTARNAFYRAIRKAKRECWEIFLEGPQAPRGLRGEGPHQDNKNIPCPEDTARCWQALKYTGSKAQARKATPTLTGPDGKCSDQRDNLPSDAFRHHPRSHHSGNHAQKNRERSCTEGTVQSDCQKKPQE